MPSSGKLPNGIEGGTAPDSTQQPVDATRDSENSATVENKDDSEESPTKLDTNQPVAPPNSPVTGVIATPSTESATDTSSPTAQPANQDSQQSEANTSACAGPDPVTSVPNPRNQATNELGNAPAPTTSAPIHSSFLPGYTIAAQSSSSFTFSPFAVPYNMGMPAASTNIPATTNSVRFANTTAVQHPDGTISQQPINPPATATSTDTKSDADKMPACSCTPQTEGGVPPPTGPPAGPPAAPPAAADPPGPFEGRGSSGATPAAAPAAVPAPAAASAAPAAAPTTAAPPQPQPYPRVICDVQPPIGPRAAAAMNQPQYIMMGGAPAPQHSQQPFLWVNPPMVAPSIPAPPPGSFGTWCYPYQSPFWADGNRTAAPPNFYMAERTLVAQDAYIAQPEYGYQGAPTAFQMPQPPNQVQYYVNGSTGPFVYYT